MRLSERLFALYSELTPGLAVVDICCDHGLLGLFAYDSKLFPEIVFIDQVPLIMQSLEKKFLSSFKNPDNPTKVTFITADGGKVKTALKGNIVVAGVGGLNMMEILLGLYESGNLQGEKLILSPHRNPELFMKDSLFGYTYSHTTEVEESGRMRPIFVFTKKTKT